MSAETQSPAPSPDNTVKDIVLWRRRTLSATVLIAATATWVLMQVYQFTFLTVISWVVMFLVASFFLWANMLRLLGIALPSLSGLELTEESTQDMANRVRAWSEEGIKWMFRVSTEEEWTLFIGVVAGLWLLSYVACRADFLTFLYMVIIAGLTVPVIYVKNEDRIKSCVAWMKAKRKRSYEIIDERAIQKIKSRVINNKEKETKAE